VGKLPAPVVPFFGEDILESGSDSGGKFLGHFLPLYYDHTFAFWKNTINKKIDFYNKVIVKKNDREVNKPITRLSIYINYLSLDNGFPIDTYDIDFYALIWYYFTKTFWKK
jgi:hypothetical protein